ncbi:MAG: lactate utilization protein [Bacteroidetes bacterium]|nr:lactate utilization protein [Bacteroidota bacterium]
MPALELYVILLDNGRSEVLGHEQQRQAMTCIKCGACQSVCPVYRTAGVAEFPSPIAAVTLPLMGADHKHLSQASTLCGACKDVCPVKIDIPRYFWKTEDILLKREIPPERSVGFILPGRKRCSNGKS